MKIETPTASQISIDTEETSEPAPVAEASKKGPDSLEAIHQSDERAGTVGRELHGTFDAMMSQLSTEGSSVRASIEARAGAGFIEGVADCEVEIERVRGGK